MKSEAKGGLLSRETKPPFDPPRERQGRFDLTGGPAPPFWIILPALLTARHCCARTQSAARLPSLAPHGVRRGCWMNRLAGTRGEARTLHLHCAARAVIQAANCQCWGSRGTPLAFSWGSKGIFSHAREYPPYFIAAPSALPPLPRRARDIFPQFF